MIHLNIFTFNDCNLFFFWRTSITVIGFLTYCEDWRGMKCAFVWHSSLWRGHKSSLPQMELLKRETINFLSKHLRPKNYLWNGNRENSVSVALGAWNMNGNCFICTLLSTLELFVEVCHFVFLPIHLVSAKWKKRCGQALDLRWQLVVVLERYLTRRNSCDGQASW